MSAATQRRVAEPAGTSLASVTYHHPTRDDLMIAAMASAAERVVERIGTLRSRVMAGTLALVDACMELIEPELTDTRSDSTVLVEATLAAARSSALRPSVLAARDATGQLFADVVAVPGSEAALMRAFEGVMLSAISQGPDADRAAIRSELDTLCALFGITGSLSRRPRPAQAP